MESKSQYDKFNCKVCLDMAQSPVITPCGHLYCWECIYKWSEQQESPDNTTCPFCNNPFDIDKVSTIYTGEESQGKVPPRPKPKRNPKKDSNPFSNIHFSFGVGMPFFNFMEFNLNNNTINRTTGQTVSSTIIFVIFILFNLIIPQYQSTSMYNYDGLNINSLQLILVIAIPLIMQIIPRINT